MYVSILLSSLVFCLLLLVGCSRNAYLSVQTVYFTRESLASYYVETPDPMLIHPPVEQKLLISWAFPRHFLKDKDNLHLNIRIRLKNKEEEVLDIPLTQAYGTYIYRLVNERYFETKGILTYKVDLIGSGCILEEWRHQLWHELIKVGEDG